MGQTMGDLILLDSVLRSSNMTSTAVGAVPDPVACAARVDTNISLSGLRLGLPSNFGWVNPGLSSQVILALKITPTPLHPTPPHPTSRALLQRLCLTEMAARVHM